MKKRFATTKKTSVSEANPTILDPVKLCCYLWFTVSLHCCFCRHKVHASYKRTTSVKAKTKMVRTAYSFPNSTCLKSPQWIEQTHSSLLAAYQIRSRFKPCPCILMLCIRLVIAYSRRPHLGHNSQIVPGT